MSAAAVLLLLLLAQIVLPRIAAGQISSKVGRYGHVRSVDVSAWPAVELLWGHAGSVSVHADSLKMSPAQTAKLLWEARGLHDLDVDVEEASVGNLRVTGARLRKRGATLEAGASTTRAAVAAALPSGVGVSLLHSGDGQVEVAAAGGLFGLGYEVDAVASAEEGKLVVTPRGALLSAFKLTLFEDAHVHLTGLAATTAGTSAGYRLSLTALLH